MSAHRARGTQRGHTHRRSQAAVGRTASELALHLKAQRACTLLVQRQQVVRSPGELGGDPLWAPLLIGLGVHELSMTPAALPEVRFVLRHSAVSELRELASKVVACADAGKTRALLQDFAAAKLKLR